MTEDLIIWLRDRLAEREALLLHTQAAGIPCPVPITTLLAEVEAKRRILDDHELLANGMCDRCSNGMYSSEQQIWPCTTVRLLALPYAARDGYREEWRP